MFKTLVESKPYVVRETIVDSSTVANVTNKRIQQAITVKIPEDLFQNMHNQQQDFIQKLIERIAETSHSSLGSIHHEITVAGHGAVITGNLNHESIGQQLFLEIIPKKELTKQTNKKYFFFTKKLKKIENIFWLTILLVVSVDLIYKIYRNNSALEEIFKSYDKSFSQNIYIDVVGIVLSPLFIIYAFYSTYIRNAHEEKFINYNGTLFLNLPTEDEGTYAQRQSDDGYNILNLLQNHFNPGETQW